MEENLLGNALGKNSGMIYKTQQLKIYRLITYKSNLTVMTQVVSPQNAVSCQWQLAADVLRHWFDFVKSHF